MITKTFNVGTWGMKIWCFSSLRSFTSFLMNKFFFFPNEQLYTYRDFRNWDNFLDGTRLKLVNEVQKRDVLQCLCTDISVTVKFKKDYFPWLGITVISANTFATWKILTACPFLFQSEKDYLVFYSYSLTIISLIRHDVPEREEEMVKNPNRFKHNIYIYYIHIYIYCLYICIYRKNLTFSVNFWYTVVTYDPNNYIVSKNRGWVRSGSDPFENYTLWQASPNCTAGLRPIRDSARVGFQW